MIRRRLAPLLRLDSTTPDWTRGLRMAVVILGPVFAGVVTGRTAQAGIAALGALNVGAADVGGDYPDRARVLLTATVLNAGAVTAGSLAGEHFAVAVPLMFVAAAAPAMLAVLDNAAATRVGFFTTILFLLGTGAPSTPPDAMPRFVAALAGGAWAVAVTLSVWPLHPDRPARRAVAACFDAVATLLDASLRSGGEPAPALEQAMRQRLSDARATVLERQRRREGSSPVGRRLRDLLALADATGHTADSFAATLRAVAAEPAVHRVLPLLTAAGGQLSAAMRSVGATLAERPGPMAVRPAVEPLLATAEKAVAADPDGGIPVRIAVRDLAVMLRRMAVRTDAALGRVAGRPLPPPAQLPGVAVAEREAEAAAARGSSFRAMARTVAGNLTVRSVTFRHAVRLGVAAAAAEALAQAGHLQRGYWIVLTAVIVLRANVGATVDRALQRVGGTLLGALIGAGIGALIGAGPGSLAALAVLAFATYAAQPLNYGLFVVFLTPMVVILIEAGQTGSWSVAGARILDTLAGGALALGFGHALWPSSERAEARQTVAAAVRDTRKYLLDTLSVYTGQDVPAARLAGDRRAAELSADNATVILQRVRSDPERLRGDVEGLVAATNVIGDVRREVAALQGHLRDYSRTSRLDGIGDFRNAAARALEEVATAVDEDRPIHERVGLDAALLAAEQEVAALRETRAAEIAQGDTRMTAARQGLRDHSLVVRHGERIAVLLDALAGALSASAAA